LENPHGGVGWSEQFTLEALENESSNVAS